MAHSYTHIPYSETGYFSKLVTEYLAGQPEIEPFFTFTPDANGIAEAIAQRNSFPVNRATLVSVLSRQYEDIVARPEVLENIRSLANDDTFTITTAHQPNLLTGYLYFVYKILHAIKLAEELRKNYPGKHFVPVYYMGSEDNDIEELGVFRFRGEKYVWDGNGQGGAVGRMNAGGIKPILDRLFKVFGPPGADCEELKTLLSDAYLQKKTVGKSTHHVVNELFGRYGLVVLDPDDAELKAAFIPVMEDELLHSSAYPILTAQTEQLETRYKSQMFPRPINLFYLDDQLRERIERVGNKWVVVNTDIEFTEDEIIAQLKAHPEKFSPNVALRGLYQETILPDVAFIGGGAEVAYWLQLRTLFAHYGVFYPVILLRQSVQWIDAVQGRLRQQAGLQIADIFEDELQLEKKYVAVHSNTDWQTTGEIAAFELLINGLKEKAMLVDPTLGPAAAAALTRVKYQLTNLEKKMLRAEKKKMQVQLDRISRLKKALLPGNSLQERSENFTEYYLQYGKAFFDIVKDGIDPLGGNFLVVEEA